jgi:hypothetical protein
MNKVKILRGFLLGLLAFNIAVALASMVSFYAAQSHAPLDERQFQQVITTLRGQPGELGRRNSLSLLEKTDRLIRGWADIAKYSIGVFGGIAVLNVGLVFLCLTNAPRSEKTK